MSAGIVFHSLAAIAYAILAVSLWRPLSHGGAQARAGRVGRICLLSAIILHGIALQQSILAGQSLHLGILAEVSAAICLGMNAFWLASMLVRIDHLLLLLFLLVADLCVLISFIPDPPAALHPGNKHPYPHVLLARGPTSI